MTGHPVASVPNGFTSEGRDWNGQITDSSSPIPTGIAFVGQVYGEEKVLARAKALLAKNQFFQKTPKL
jgi:Asp-tRNA(Asn)/Glu-tRNA(Gln) amidotransferase A subunit family amidase